MVLIGGRQGALGALALIVFTACTIIFVHHFWDMNGDTMTTNMTEALKDPSIIGGLRRLAVVGAGLNGSPQFNGHDQCRR